MNRTALSCEEFSTPLRQFIRRRVRDDHVAADLLQEVFVRVHSKLETLTDDDRLAAWLFRVARNAISDHHRRRSHVELDGTEIPVDEAPDDAEVNQLVGACVGRFVARLPDGYREAVELAEMNDVPQQEIARRIGLSLSGTKSRVQRGRKLLQAMLLDCCRFEFDRSGNVLDYETTDGHGDCCAEAAITPACGSCDDN